MTERKPRDMSVQSWIDKQIQDATERGAFDNLPGTGKPLPNRGPFSTQDWIRQYLEREGVSAEEALPSPLRLRKESERLAESVHLLPSEQDVRDVVADLNARIRAYRTLPADGPPLIVRLVDEDEMLRRWRAGRPAVAAEVTPPAPDAPPRRRRFSWPRRKPRRKGRGAGADSGNAP
jgi:hypothetical protein